MSESGATINLGTSTMGGGDEDEDHHEPTTSSRLLLLTRPASTSLQSQYPGIEDYDALLFQQLRYRFQEHEFKLQWKAMQNAGWTHSGARGYQSPSRTHVYKATNDLRELLDRPAVENLKSNLQKDPVEHDMEEIDGGKENVRDLRDDIIHHMQKLIEGTRRSRASGRAGGIGTSDSESDDDDDKKPAAVEQALSDDDDDSKSNAADRSSMPRRSSRRSSTTRATAVTAPAKSVTATEKGTDLYLHRTTKGRKRKKAPVHTVDTGDLSFPTLAECAELMQSFDTTECDKIEDYYRQNAFAQWRHLLSTNHSLLLYGSGSKHQLLSDFCDQELKKEGYALQIDGFHPDVTMDGILDLLVSVFLNGREPDPRQHAGLFLQQTARENPVIGDIPEIYNFRNPSTVDRAVMVARALAQHCSETTLTPIFLVIHNLEGVGLRTELAQDALAAMVKHAVPEGGDVAALRLVASLDHVDASAAALWSSSTGFQFRWIWQEVHTHRPYIQELALLPDDDAAAAKKKKTTWRKKHYAPKQAENALPVLKTLAPRHAEVMQILAKLQLKGLRRSSSLVDDASSPSSPSSWVDYNTFFAECKSSFVIDKESKLRTLLSELKDHRLIVSKIESGSEHVSIPFAADKLKEIMAYKRGDK